MAPKKSLSEAYSLFFKNLFNFNGRTRRSDYWRVVILNAVVAGFISGAVTGFLGEESYIGSIISGIISLALFVLELGLVVRRLHDTGKEWTYILLSLIPLVGGIIVFIALVKDSDPGDNQFGPNPKGVYPDGMQFNQGFAPQQPNYAQPVPPVQNFNQQPNYAQPAAPAPEYNQQPVYNEPVAPAQDFSQQPNYAQPATPAPDYNQQPVYNEPVAPAPEFNVQSTYNQPAAPAVTYCSNCGTIIENGVAFCPSCGTPVSK